MWMWFENKILERKIIIKYIKILKQYMIKKDYLMHHIIYLEDKNILISDGI